MVRTRTASDERMSLEQLGELCGTLSKMCPKNLTREQAQLLVGANGAIGAWLEVGLTHDINQIPIGLVKALIEGRLDVECERFSVETKEKLRSRGWEIVVVVGGWTFATMMKSNLCRVGRNSIDVLANIKNDVASTPREIAWFPSDPLIPAYDLSHFNQIHPRLKDLAGIPEFVVDEVVFVKPCLGEALSIAGNIGYGLSGYACVFTNTYDQRHGNLGVILPVEVDEPILVLPFISKERGAGFLKLLAPV